MKQCGHCKELKSLENFNNHARNKDGKGHLCKPCAIIKLHQWQKENPEKKKLQDARRRKKVPHLLKNNRLKYLYGITLTEYELMVKNQDGKCKICNKLSKLYVDHDHKTNLIRGLLCHRCNVAIGLFRENQESILNAISYLQK